MGAEDGDVGGGVLGGGVFVCVGSLLGRSGEVALAVEVLGDGEVYGSISEERFRVF